MLAALAYYYDEFPKELGSKLLAPREFTYAARELIENVSGLMKHLNRENVYAPDLLSLRDYVVQVIETPKVVAHWENHQVEGIKTKGEKCYEGLLRTLQPKNLQRIANKDVISFRKLVSSGETKVCEFKPALRWDFGKKETNAFVEHATLKTICAFLNTEGGRLLIGVGDDGQPVGLEADYATFGLAARNRDGFERHLYQLIHSQLGVTAVPHVAVDFLRVRGQDVCVVKVTASRKAVYLARGKDHEFWIRLGNQSRSLDPPSAQNYLRARVGRPPF